MLSQVELDEDVFNIVLSVPVSVILRKANGEASCGGELLKPRRIVTSTCF